MYTVLVANTVALMTDADLSAKAYNNKLNHLEDYMTFMKLPKELRLRITNYFQARYGGKWYDEKDVLNWVSSSIKEEILMIMCSGLVRRVPIFRTCDTSFINTILFHLQSEVFQEGDVIFYENTPADRMFFIERGHVVVETESSEMELCDGGYFGDTYLLTRGKHLATVRAQTICQVFSLSLHSFYKVLEDYPEVLKDMMKTKDAIISFDYLKDLD